MKKVLFVVHESKKTGAPLLLLHLLKVLKVSKSLEMNILISKTGDLDEAFEDIAHCYYYTPKYLLRLNITSKILRKLLPEKITKLKYRERLFKELKSRNYDVLYFNSLGSYPMYAFLEDYIAKKVTHVHELQTVVDSLDSIVVSKMIQNSDMVLSSYRVVTKFVKDTYKIKEKQLVENNVYLFPDRQHAIDQLVQRNLNRPVDKEIATFKIGACGSVEHRKGTDIFVDFAIYMLEKYPNCKLEFIWIGQNQTTLGRKLMLKIEERGMQHNIKFIGPTSTPEQYFVDLDVFFLSSREEAFGLVGLENAYCENPLIAFDIEGDLPKFITKYNCGKILPKFEVMDFEEFIMELIGSPKLKKSLGLKAKEAVISDFKIEDQTKIIYNTLKNLQ